MPEHELVPEETAQAAAEVLAGPKFSDDGRKFRGRAREREHPTAGEPLVSIEGIAKTLGVSRRVVERLRRQGSVPPPDVHIGRFPRWKPETIRQWIQDQVETTGRID